MKTKPTFIFVCLAAGISIAAQAGQSSVPGQLSSATATSTSLSASKLVSIREAFEAAWQRAVQRGEVEGLVSRSKAQQDVASNFLAGPPSLELAQRTDRWHDARGSRENGVGVVMPIWLPGQRGARIASAEIGLRVSDAAVASARLRLAGDVREAAWIISAQNAEFGIAEDQAAYLKQLATDVLRRVDAGDLARSDWLAAEADLLAASAAVLDARLRLQLAMSRWKLLTGLDTPPDASEGSPGVGKKMDPHPESALASLAQDRAKRQVDLAATAKWDSPELALKFREDIPATGIPAKRSVGISLRIPLGASERGVTQLAEAQASRTVAELHLLREQDRLREAVLNATLAVEMAQRSLAAEQLRASRLTERASLIEKSFTLGESPLTDLLRARSAAAQALGGRAKQEAAAGLASARLKQANGELP